MKKILVITLILIMVIVMMPLTAMAATTASDAVELMAALAAGGNVALGADIACGTVSGNAFTIASGKTVALDLNGHVISADTNNGAIINNAGTLTISDSSSAKSGKIVNTNTTQKTDAPAGGVAKSAISNTGVLVVNTGVIVVGPASSHGSYGSIGFNPAYGIDNLGGGNVTINNASVSGGYGMRNFANVTNTTITINGGRITGRTGIAMQSFGTNIGSLTINGDTTVAATKSAIYAAGVTSGNYIEINGGTFSGENDYGTVCVVDGTVSISGGTFTGKNDTYSMINYYAVVTITAGVFNGHLYGGEEIEEPGYGIGLTTFAPAAGKHVFVNGLIEGNVEGEELVEAGNGATDVTADIDPVYTIVIPASVDFDTLVKDTGIASIPFNITASGLLLEAGAKVNITVVGDFRMSDGGTELPYELYNIPSDGTALSTGDQFASFGADGVKNGRAEVDTGIIASAGSFKDTMTFTITYVN